MQVSPGWVRCEGEQEEEVRLYKRVIGRLWLKQPVSSFSRSAVSPEHKPAFHRSPERCGWTRISAAADQMEKHFSRRGHMMEKHIAVRWHHRLCHISWDFVLHRSIISRLISGGFFKSLSAADWRPCEIIVSSGDLISSSNDLKSDGQRWSVFLNCFIPKC